MQTNTRPQTLALLRRLGIVAALPLAALLGGCPMPPGQNGDPNNGDPNNGDGSRVTADATVIIRNLAFQPDEVTINPGQRVRWINDDEIEHTTTSGAPESDNAGDVWDSGLLQPGEFYVRQFDQEGEYAYFCREHPNLMRARVIVAAPELPATRTRNP